MFALYKNSDGIYQVCDRCSFSRSEADSPIEKKMVLLAYNDDKIMLDQLCYNLNCKSPRIDLRNEDRSKSDSKRNNGPCIVDDQFIKPKKIVFRLSTPEKDINTSYQEKVDESGSLYNPSDTDITTESEVQNSKNESIINESANMDLSSPVVDQNYTDEAVNTKLSFNVPGNSAVDDNDLIVDSSEGRKKNFCFFCKTYQSQLARHLIHKHCAEKEVTELKNLPPKSIERKRLIAQIRKNGNFLLLDKNFSDGKLIPLRRPTNEKKYSAKDYIVCPDCKGLYTKNNIRHHYSNCTGQAKSSRGILKIARAVIGRIHERASIRMRQKVIPRMHEDDIVRIIRYDLLLILYGNDLCLRHRREYRDKMIRQNLRQCGKFLLFLKAKNSKITDFSSIYDTNHYHFILDSIDAFIGLDEDTGHYKSASSATSLARHIKEIGKIYINECIIIKDREKEKEIKKFLHLCGTGFATVTNKTAMETLVAQQRKKVVTLPLSNDIALLNSYLDKVIDEYYSTLKLEFSVVVWQKLAEALLTRVQVFNRRRPGDIERLEVADMKNVHSINEHDEDYKSLSKDEREAAKEYVRVSMRGKLNQNVPILLTKRWHEIMLLLIKLRREAGVKPKNIYVFGIPGIDDQAVLIATALLRKFSEKCDAKNPKALRATPLRKHAATKCAQLGLDEANTVNFAKFMGHDLKIHKNIYRQSVAKTDILGISKVLETASKSKQNDSLSDVNQFSSSQSDLDVGILNIPFTHWGTIFVVIGT
ncbi:uncharacterized protein LOC112906158 [Agrilus planipennis]|uniref:Uncharacterized protein LOC112906158 n=1 Tax=Agrilus planipennis TaxID=224129 RepID=A0A7F5RIJ8_AGRPL|nr:uncharacterized protein LOC112906158 [Agrilus planipennis]